MDPVIESEKPLLNGRESGKLQAMLDEREDECVILSIVCLPCILLHIAFQNIGRRV